MQSSIFANMIAKTNDVRAKQHIFRDAGDWPQTFVFVLFLGIFPVAIGWMWTEQTHEIPLWVLVPFTLAFAVCMPFLISSVRDARTRTLVVNRGSGTITLIWAQPFATRIATAPLASMTGLLIEKTDDDGPWYRAIACFENDGTFTIAQGGSDEFVRRIAANLIAVLRDEGHTIKVSPSQLEPTSSFD